MSGGYPLASTQADQYGPGDSQVGDHRFLVAHAAGFPLDKQGPDRLGRRLQERLPTL